MNDETLSEGIILTGDANRYLKRTDGTWCTAPIIFDNDSSVEKFRKMCEEMAQTYRNKNATYGDAYSDGFKRFGATQLVSRIYEKYCRVENLLCHKADNKVPDESVKDTLTDMAVQCLVLRMLIEDNDMEHVK